MTQHDDLVSQLREQAEWFAEQEREWNHIDCPPDAFNELTALLCRAADALEARSEDSADLDWLEANPPGALCVITDYARQGRTLRQAIRAARNQEGKP